MVFNNQEEKRLVTALRELDIQGSRQRELRVGDYILRDLLGEGSDYQDHRATHRNLQTVEARVRTYSSTLEPVMRERAQRLARREFQLLHDLHHDAILTPRQLTEYELGTALIYPYYPEAMRLDHYLESRDGLDFLHRLRLWAQIGEALRYAHQRQLLHRSLAPQNVLVGEAGGAPQARVFNWHTARGLDASTGTLHVHQLVSDDVAPYIAPELVDYPHLTDFRSDLFSLGCLGYYLFTRQGPARDYDALMDRLLEADALDLRAVLEDAPASLVKLIADLTRLDVTDRVASAEEFLSRLAEVERELAQATPAVTLVSPFEALPGQAVLPGWLLEQKLGQGASAMAFLVKAEDGDEHLVLKVALDPSRNEALEGEAEVLRRLKHPQIVELRQETETHGRVTLLLGYAGSETLAQRLAREGPLPLEFLQRWGDDLLGLVETLEDQGVFHRDIKPANLGLKPYGKQTELRLIMFDFSLARAPLEATRAGTAAYRDPFVAARRTFDTHAERYTAAVTLHEMATGILPQWGDGLSTPRGPDAELQLATERFEPDLRARFETFFTRALHRDAPARFANAHEMRLAWNNLFVGVHESAHEPLILLDTAHAETPLVELTGHPILLEAFERLQVREAGPFLALSLKKPGLLPGLGGQSRRLLLDFQVLLANRYEGLRPPAPTQPARGSRG